MAVQIRLMRMGKKKRPYYRIVVTDGRNQRDGRYLDSLGFYHPIEEGNLSLDLDKYNEWIVKGAQATGIVQNLVKKVKKMNG